MRALSLSAASEPANKEFGPKFNRGERLKATAVAQSEGREGETSRAESPCAFGRRHHTWREPVKHWTTWAAAGCLIAAAFVPANAADISGAGATFPYPIYAKWADEYKKVTGNGLNYQSIGSGGGLNKNHPPPVHVGASDMPLQPPELAKI